MVCKQACRQCRRRKVKCDGMPTCRNCFRTKTACQYPTPKKRGPKPVKWQDDRPEEPDSTTSTATVSSEEVEGSSLPAPASSYPYLASDSPLLNTVTANALLDES
ncbi:hypothetical protein BFJ63_vAg18031 [Fusarium oxysporum f. sp. narcissi]|uniref:Zn(2)-C6 fungal-type domain-containing protein n=1 Tax=Fusarium oxysporum f. sp. narcissi TaxID=451672 RepID=A0A4Q2V5D5_FUSOX|nr:hypothetical protein BFJ63_vAg18031 [Fusarium oxysporum f. sp. narcissi]